MSSAHAPLSPPPTPLVPNFAGLGPVTLVRHLVRHRYLLRQLVRKNIATTYQGSLAGIAWMVLRPLLMLVIFTFVFGVVYQGRFYQERTGASLEFGVVIFLGLTIFSVAAEMASTAPGLIAGNPNFVKRVVFPLDLLVVAQLGASLVQLAVSAVILVGARLFMEPPLGFAAISVPFVIVPLLLWTLGVAWMLASVGVFVRDLQQVVPLFVTALMFLSPLFYPVSAVPPALRSTVYLNPLTFVLESARNALFLNQWPDPVGFAVYTVISMCVMWIGWAWFEKTKKGFADVL
jgi:lipopolysaccharide transport system permease protein